MKKFILSFLLFILAGSCGGFIVSTVQAQTITPSEAATLNASLQGMKADLLKLEAQAAAQPASPTVSANTSLSAQDTATLQSELSELTVAFSNLSATIAANPQSLTASNRIALRSILGDMSNSLLAMDQDLAGTSASAPIAAVTGPSVTVSPSGQVTAQVSPSAANQGQSNISPANTAAPQTASVADQVSSPSHGWMLTLGIIILLLVIYLVWKSSSKKKAKPQSGNQASVAPVAKVSVPVPSVQKSVEAKVSGPQDSPRSPVSSVVNPPPPGQL